MQPATRRPTPTTPGQFASETDPKGNKTTNQYDAYGDILSTTDALGDTTSYTYHVHGILPRRPIRSET